MLRIIRNGEFSRGDATLPVTKSANSGNELIARLRLTDRRHLLAGCKEVELNVGDVLCEATRPMSHVYFPLAGFISLVISLHQQPPLEMGLIGSEGMLGITLILGIKGAPMRAIVQGPGRALRMSVAALGLEMVQNRSLARVLDRYLYVLVTQLIQASACARFHEIQPRLARWLLMTQDRAHADHFHLTHQYLADMLGVRRSGITLAAEKLRSQRLISYRRGDISILDRSGLELASCECYGAMIDDYDSIIAANEG